MVVAVVVVAGPSWLPRPRFTWLSRWGQRQTPFCVLIGCGQSGEAFTVGAVGGGRHKWLDDGPQDQDFEEDPEVSWK